MRFHLIVWLWCVTVIDDADLLRRRPAYAASRDAEEFFKVCSSGLHRGIQTKVVVGVIAVAESHRRISQSAFRCPTKFRSVVGSSWTVRNPSATSRRTNGFTRAHSVAAMLAEPSTVAAKWLTNILRIFGVALSHRVFTIRTYRGTSHRSPAIATESHITPKSKRSCIN